MSSLAVTIGKNRSNDPSNPPPITPMKKTKMVDTHPIASANGKDTGNDEFISSEGIITCQPSSSGNSQLVWPKADELWKIIRDSAVSHILRDVPNTNAYITATRYFCGHLHLIMYGLSVEELSTTGRATMPAFFTTLPKNNQNVLTKALEAAWNWA